MHAMLLISAFMFCSPPAKRPCEITGRTREGIGDEENGRTNSETEKNTEVTVVPPTISDAAWWIVSMSLVATHWYIPSSLPQAVIMSRSFPSLIYLLSYLINSASLYHVTLAGG